MNPIRTLTRHMIDIKQLDSKLSIIANSLLQEMREQGFIIKDHKQESDTI